jgi:post-segregation antitoxin (ccd killing protein)
VRRSLRGHPPDGVPFPLDADDAVAPTAPGGTSRRSGAAVLGSEQEHEMINIAVSARALAAARAVDPEVSPAAVRAAIDAALAEHSRQHRRERGDARPERDPR